MSFSLGLAVHQRWVQSFVPAMALHASSCLTIVGFSGTSVRAITLALPSNWVLTLGQTDPISGDGHFFCDISLKNDSLLKENFHPAVGSNPSRKCNAAQDCRWPPSGLLSDPRYWSVCLRSEPSSLSVFWSC